MKIKKIKNYNLINSNLFYSRNYLGLKKLSFYYLNSSYIMGFRNKFSLFNLKYTKNFIKIILLLIYKFHYYNKKILFIGFPNILNNNFNCSMIKGVNNVVVKTITLYPVPIILNFIFCFLIVSLIVCFI